MICLASDRVGQLNAFQRVMLQWSELCPYNAVHTYKLAGPLDVARLQESVRDAFDFNGIGVAEIDGELGWYSHRRDDRPSIGAVGGEGSAEDRLIEHVGREINRPFERPMCRPFRIAALDAGPNSHYVILTYDHWASDSIGARLVMRHVLGRYLGLDIPENSETLELYPGTYAEMFSRRLRGPGLAMPVLRSVCGWVQNRSAWQTAYASVRQPSVGYGLYRVQPQTVEAVRQFARAMGASVNDVFVAALGRALRRFLPRRHAKNGAASMAVGTIVDTRADAVEDLSESLGTFLGYYVVRLAGDQMGDLDRLTRLVAARTSAIKARRSYLDSAVNLRIASAIWPRLPPEGRAHFARRLMPLTAGVSNVYLRDSWLSRYGAGRILDFHRAVSTGPSLPLVVSPTTFCNQMTLGVNYRETGFSRRRIDDIMVTFIEQLETLAEKPALRRAA
jgi:NRPS condensation-like uncharacterized protein